MDIEFLLGKTIDIIRKLPNDEGIAFKIGIHTYHLAHVQVCCETVFLEDVCGDLQDLLVSPILLAEEVQSEESLDSIREAQSECYTWTFYKLATVNGYVDLRFYGESNGYYSETADFYKVNK